MSIELATLLHAAIRKSMDTGLHAFALIDPALLGRASVNAFPAQYVRTLPLRGIGADGEGVVPFLVEIAASATAAQNITRTTLPWALESHAVTWLATSLECPELLNRLGARLDARLPDSGAEIVLRYCDARVLPAVHEVLEDDDRSTFFGVAEHWWYLDRVERLCRLDSQVVKPDPFAGLQLTRAQRNGLERHAHPDAVIRLLREQASQHLNRIPRPERHAFVCDRLDEAAQWGIVDTGQQSMFCLVALMLGPGFSLGEPWQARLGRVRAGETSLQAEITAAEQDDA